MNSPPTLPGDGSARETPTIDYRTPLPRERRALRSLVLPRAIAFFLAAVIAGAVVMCLDLFGADDTNLEIGPQFSYVFSPILVLLGTLIATAILFGAVWLRFKLTRCEKLWRSEFAAAATGVAFALAFCTPILLDSVLTGHGKHLPDGEAMTSGRGEIVSLILLVTTPIVASWVVVRPRTVDAGGIPASN
jgi:hypothetical protein